VHAQLIKDIFIYGFTVGYIRQVVGFEIYNISAYLAIYSSTHALCEASKHF